MSKGDQLIERGADRLEELSRKAAAKGGFAAKLADELAEDAVFLRKLKPSLIAARARAQSKNEAASAPTNEQPAVPMTEPVAAPANEPVAAEPPPQAVGSTSRLEPAGEAPTSEPAAQPEAPAAPPPHKKKRSGGPNPFVVAGIALAAGILLAKVIDWRGHAHPRD